jgi:serine/threonine protein kinase
MCSGLGLQSLSHEEFVELSTRGFRRERRISNAGRFWGTSVDGGIREDDSAVREDHWPAWILKYSAQDTIGWYPRKIGTYQKIEKIGQGTYSTVYKVRHFPTTERCKLL